MSNKTRLQTNNTNLQTLIDKANALPDAGGGGGGSSVETCTVKIQDGGTSGSIVFVGTTILNQNEIVPYTFEYNPSAYNLTIENVLCGGNLTLGVSGYGAMTGFMANGAQSIYTPSTTMRSFHITAGSGQTATITYYLNEPD